jgi:CRISPR/Cas system endoribonuclease Cas6 (RAMP superfamily)
MRFKIKLNLDKVQLSDVAVVTAKEVHKLLGDNNKWHDLVRKPFSCSLIRGGKLIDKTIHFDEDAFIYINTEDDEVINALLSSNPTFSIEKPKVFKDYNLLKVKNVVFNADGKKTWITDDNKDRFIKHIENRYAIKLEVLKIKNSLISYKNNIKLPVSDLLIKIPNNVNVGNLFESGIGGSCSLGFGFVETLNKD